MLFFTSSSSSSSSSSFGCCLFYLKIKADQKQLQHKFVLNFIDKNKRKKKENTIKVKKKKAEKERNDSNILFFDVLIIYKKLNHLRD